MSDDIHHDREVNQIAAEGLTRQIFGSIDLEQAAGAHDPNQVAVLGLAYVLRGHEDGLAGIP